MHCKAKTIKAWKGNITEAIFAAGEKHLRRGEAIALALLFSFAFFSCARVSEMTLEEIAAARIETDTDLIARTVSRPYNGDEYKAGKEGGVWRDIIMGDPKTFNYLIAEADGQSASIMNLTTTWLFDYDAVRRDWKPMGASWKVDTDEAQNTMTLHCTIRDDLFWTYPDKDEKIPVTSDDIVWWYNEVAGDKSFQSSAYNSQFVTMEDGSTKRIECVKKDDKRFDFIFPRMTADPLLAANMQFYPAFIYRAAKEAGGTEAVKSLFSVADDPKTLPSCGRWHIVEYRPSISIKMKRNKDYWEKDANGVSQPYPNEMMAQIVGDNNTAHLLFKQGKTETFSPSPENVADLVKEQEAGGYTVYNAGGNLGTMLWSFNQNPVNGVRPWAGWFSKKEFRQAMSCLLNRDRIIAQVYRGLGEAKLDFFPEPNPCYNPDIKLQYTYNPKRAAELLKKCGMSYHADGALYDEAANKVEFDITIPSANNTANDIAQVIADECGKVGITINVRQADFQKMVESLLSSFDWQSVMIGLGTQMFPSQGSNVWPSSGNLHLWHPFQEKPATDWEARIDALYNEGCHTVDKTKAIKIWDEYQRLILEECPVIYLIRQKSFTAVNNRWDQTNFYYDNINGAMTDWVYLAAGSGQ